MRLDAKETAHSLPLKLTGRKCLLPAVSGAFVWKFDHLLGWVLT